MNLLVPYSAIARLKGLIEPVSSAIKEKSKKYHKINGPMCEARGVVTAAKGVLC
jgi:hypothetical protein